MTERIACPYCNTGFTPDQIPESGRLTCPRCGESFVDKRLASTTPGTGSAGTIYPASVNGEYPPPRPEPTVLASVFRPLLVIAGGLAVVLLIAFVAYFSRRSPAPTTVPTSIPIKPASIVPPPVLPGLGYLPADSHLVVAFQPASALALATRSKVDGRTFLAQLGVPAVILSGLDRAKLRPESIEVIAISLILPDDNAIPRGLAVVLLREPPTDAAAIRTALGAQPFTASDGSARAKVDFGGLPLELLELTPTTYLFATDSKDLTQAANRTATGIASWPAPIRDGINNLSPASFAWLVTDSQAWSKKPTVRLAAGAARQPDLPARLEAMQSLAASLAFEPELTVAARLTFTTADTATDWRIRLEQARADLPVFELGGSGSQMTLTGPIDPAKGLPDIESWLPKPPPPAPKDE